jgi:small conductance mechanosensitive channel
MTWLDYLNYTVSPVLILICTIIVSKIVNYLFSRRLYDKVAHKLDLTQYAIIKRILVAIVYIIGILSILYSIPPLKTWAYSLIASAGVMAIIIGFAAQDAFKNIVAGVFIAIFQPFRINDSILYNNISGVVEDINLRHTILTTAENNRVIIPNASLLAADITNFTISDERIVKIIDFSISYDSNIDKAKKIIADECEKHPSCFNVSIHESKKILNKKMNDKTCAVNVKVVELGEYAVKLRTWVWAKDPVTAFHLYSDILESVKKRFDKEGIEIPYPYRTVIVKK